MSRNNAAGTIKDRALGKADPLVPIPVSLLIGGLLTVYPLPYGWMAWRPEFMLLLALFWVLLQPKWCGVWFAFMVGIITDFLLDAPLGEHALVFVIVTFLSRFLTRNKRMLTFGNVWIIASITVLVSLMLLFAFQRITGNVLSLWFWAPLLPSIMVWPFMYTFLKRWRAS